MKEQLNLPTRNKVVVIGNGVSRKGFDLSQFNDECVIGCNALHRDYTPTYLVVCDNRMYEEVLYSDYIKTNWVFFRSIMGFNNDRRNSGKTEISPPENAKDLKEYINDEGQGSGICALRLAVTMKPKEIHMLGFDFGGHNIYEGTNGYPKQAYKEITGTNWRRGFEKIRLKNSHIQFIDIMNKI